MDRKKIIIAGGCGVGKTALSQAIINHMKNEGFDIITISERKPDLVIQGVEYFERPRPQGITLDMLCSMVGMTLKTPDMPPYNLITEFSRIQCKQSKLSRSQREYIINKFNKVYEKK